MVTASEEKLEATFHQWLLRQLIPVVQWVGRHHLPLKTHRISEDDYKFLRELLRPGMVFCTRRRGECNNLLIPGFWTHAALYMGNGIVLEATAAGVAPTDLETFLCGRQHGKDFVKVREATFMTPEVLAEALQIADSIRGKPYDWLFTSTDDDRAFYCSKVIWYSFEKAYRKYHLGAASPFTLRKSLGVDTVTPEDIGLATAKWRTVYCSAGVPISEAA